MWWQIPFSGPYCKRLHLFLTPNRHGWSCSDSGCLIYLFIPIQWDADSHYYCSFSGTYRHSLSRIHHAWLNNPWTVSIRSDANKRSWNIQHKHQKHWSDLSTNPATVLIKVERLNIFFDELDLSLRKDANIRTTSVQSPVEANNPL